MDVSFSGDLALLIPIERAASYGSFAAYLWDAKKQEFVREPSFQNIPNPAIDTAKKRIFSKRSGDQKTLYTMYSFDDGEFVRTNMLFWQPADLETDDMPNAENLSHLIELNETADDPSEMTVQDFYAARPNPDDPYSIDEEDTRIKPYFASGSFWDLESEKWRCTFLTELSSSFQTAVVSSEREEVSSTNSANDTDIATGTYLKPVSGKSDAYNQAVKAFDEFLLGKRATETSYGDEYFVKVYHPLDEDSRSEDIDTFALMDITGDGIPELHTRSSAYYNIYSYQNNEIKSVFDTNTLHGPVYLLENGMMFTTHATTGTIYTFTTFAADGTNTDLWFLDTDGHDGSYQFDGKFVTKTEWDELTKDYFALAEKPAAMEWYDYISVTLLDVLQNKKKFLHEDGSEIFLWNYKAPNEKDQPMPTIESYAFMDLDFGDSLELVIKCKSPKKYDVYIVLWYDAESETVHGCDFFSDGISLEVKANGTCRLIWGDYAERLFKMELLDSGSLQDVFASHHGDSYNLSGISVTKQIFDEYIACWEQQDDPLWATDYLS